MLAITPTYTPAQRFANLIESLYKLLGTHGYRRRIAGPLLVVIWGRLRQLAKRFARLDACLCAPARWWPAPRAPEVPRGARLDRRTASVTSWHLELDRHDVIIAEGLPAETYLDTGNCAAFANARAAA